MKPPNYSIVKTRAARSKNCCTKFSMGWTLPVTPPWEVHNAPAVPVAPSPPSAPEWKLWDGQQLPPIHIEPIRGLKLPWMGSTAPGLPPMQPPLPSPLPAPLPPPSPSPLPPPPHAPPSPRPSPFPPSSPVRRLPHGTAPSLPTISPPSPVAEDGESGITQWIVIASLVFACLCCCCFNQSKLVCQTMVCALLFPYYIVRECCPMCICPPCSWFFEVLLKTAAVPSYKPLDEQGDAQADGSAVGDKPLDEQGGVHADGVRKAMQDVEAPQPPASTESPAPAAVSPSSTVPAPSPPRPSLSSASAPANPTSPASVPPPVPAPVPVPASCTEAPSPSASASATKSIPPYLEREDSAEA